MEGSVFDDRYLLKEFKGSGSFGEVWLAYDQQTEVEVAVKIYVAMDSHGLSEFKKEFQVSFNLNHTNLLHANFLEVSKEEQRAYLVMPYCPLGSTSKLIGKMSEEQLWEFIRDVSSGLAYLHSQNPPVIHQDIKPDNILIARNGEFVVTDFGISRQARNTLRKSKTHLNSAGAVAYMGPERFSKQYQSVKASDIWSLGVTIYELAVGELPFCGMGGSMQKQGADIPDLPEEFSEELNLLMQSCLAKETWDRPTAEQIAEYTGKCLKEGRVRPPWLRVQEVSQVYTVRYYNGDKLLHSVELACGELIPEYLPPISGFLAWEGEQTQKMPDHDLIYKARVEVPPTVIPFQETTSTSWLSWVVIAVAGLVIGAVLSLL